MKNTLLLLISFMLFSIVAYPQTKTGTTIGQFLLIEPSSRISAMGNAGASLHDELFSIYYNPGAIGHIKGYQMAFTHSMWFADIVYDYAGVGINADELGNLYASVTSLNSGEIDVRTVSQPLGTGERYTVNDIAIGIGYGKQISERFSVGLQINYIQETIWHTSLSTFGLNIGTLYQLSDEGLNIGASISNFGFPAKYSGQDLRIRYDQNQNVNGDNSNLPGELFTEEYPLPVFFRVGLSMPFQLGPTSKVTVVLDAFHPSDNTESMSMGAEWMFKNLFALRAGYQNLFQQDSEVGLTLGAGLAYDVGGYDFLFDYAWADYGRLQNTQRLTLGVSF